MSAPQPSVAPPSYDSPAPAKKAYGAVNDNADVNAPLLGAQAGSSSQWPSGDHDDFGPEDDFEIGVTVSQSSAEVRNAFVRKVYAVRATSRFRTHDGTCADL